MVAQFEDRLRPRPLSTLLASAQRITSSKVNRHTTSTDNWQADAWEMYDLVGEERFLATTLANRVSQARLMVARMDPDDSSVGPVELVDNPITDLLSAVGDSRSGQGQLVYRLAVNLFVAGEGWLVGIPRYLLYGGAQPSPLGPLQDSTVQAMDDLDWRVLSVSEIKTVGSGSLVQLSFGSQQQDVIECRPEDVYLIRVWRPHPRRWWEADSPTRSSLPVLRELVGLTMHISAQVDSRLAGAGLLIVPQSAQRSLRMEFGLDPDSTDDANDPFTEALMEAMIRPISDRSSASALVPLVVTVPDEATALFQYLTFSKPLDTEARNLRDEAIRRLALGQDAPPELLLGTAGMNHWGAWLVQEEVVSTHIEPLLALLCDALTTQYLWPVLTAQGMDEAEAQQYVVWYDVSHMIVRPNRAADAMALFDKGVLSDRTVREAVGFDDSDAPQKDNPNVTDAVRVALELVSKSPGLASTPGLPALVRQVAEVLSGEAETAPPPEPLFPPAEEQPASAPAPAPVEAAPPEEPPVEGGGEQSPPSVPAGPPSTGP